MSKKPAFECVAIFAGAYVDGIRSKGLACLRQVSPEETLIEKHIRLVNEYLPKAPIYLLVRNEPDKIIRSVGGKVSIVENQLDNSNDMEDIRLMLNTSRCQSVLCFFADIAANENMFKNIPNESFLLTSGKNDGDQLGVIENKGYVTSVNFGLPEVWSGMFGLQQNELLKLKKFATREKNKLFMFEGINGIIHNGARITVVSNDSASKFHFGNGRRKPRRNIHIINSEEK